MAGALYFIRVLCSLAQDGSGAKGSPQNVLSLRELVQAALFAVSEKRNPA